jgi:signal transduction histidine kinase
MSPQQEAWGIFPVVLLLLGPVALAVLGYPVFSGVVATASGSAYLAMGYPAVFVLAAAATALWWAVQDGQLVDAALVAGAGWASAVLMTAPGERDLGRALVLACLAVALLAVAESLRSRRDITQAWQSARDEARSRQAMEIRLGLIRDRQDSVLQQVSMIEVRAQVASRLVDRAGAVAMDEAVAALSAIGTAAAGARTEVDESLRMLSGEAKLVPVQTQGLEELPTLVRQWDAVGLLVTVTGAPGRLPAIVDEVAFLVVREALTNVSRHSASTRADVQLVRDGNQLMVTVTDPGPARRPRTSWRDPSSTEEIGAERGLSVLRERVVALGGAVVAGPPRVPSTVSWMVRAVLPAAAVSATGRERVAEVPSGGSGHPVPSPVPPPVPSPVPSEDLPVATTADVSGAEDTDEFPGDVPEADDLETMQASEADDLETDDLETMRTPEVDDLVMSGQPEEPRARSAQAPIPGVARADSELDLFELLSRRRK